MIFTGKVNLLMQSSAEAAEVEAAQMGVLAEIINHSTIFLPENLEVAQVIRILEMVIARAEI